MQFASLQFMLLNHKNHARRTSLLIVKPLRFTIEWTGPGTKFGRDQVESGGGGQSAEINRDFKMLPGQGLDKICRDRDCLI